MLQLLSRRLAVKLMLPLLLGVAVGFLSIATIGAQVQARSVERLQQESARATAGMLAAGVRSSMLTGNGIAVRGLLDDAKSRIDTAKVRVYDATGAEVFSEKPPAPDRERLPPWVRSVLDTRQVATGGPRGLAAFPVENEKRCMGCHADGQLRGVLTLTSDGARTRIDGSDAAISAITRIVRAGFVQIMTAKHHEMLDAYFAELAERTPGVDAAAIFSDTGARYFGSDTLEPPADALTKATSKPGPAFTVDDQGKRLHLVPLPNEPRCQGCHDPKEPMRGALVVSFDAAALDGDRTLVEASRVSLQHVMLSGLGRMVTGLLDEVRESGTVTQLALYDAEGRVYHDAFAQAVPPPDVAAALASGKPVSSAATADRPEIVFALPLANEKRCQTCHGPDRQLRGAIEVRLDTRRAANEIRRLKLQSLAAAVLTIVLLTGLIVLFVTRLVLRPVGRIGEVAERVGEGRFDEKVEVSSEDEVGRLGHRVNEMINGLRQKLELAKFVSKETLKKVESHEGEVEREGVRRRITVLFSDVRGFTAFSETREPEEVVEMLNRYLQAQAEVVTKYGGDIDKFVGDELMARFQGPDMEARAARCAVEMVAAVDALNRSLASGTAVHVGVGVHVGEMVLGAMGASDRMDFTVIGDAVNLAARLCGAAQKAEVIVTAEIAAAVEGSASIALEPMAPIVVKGKKEPIPIFRVTSA